MFFECALPCRSTSFRLIPVALSEFQLSLHDRKPQIKA